MINNTMIPTNLLRLSALSIALLGLASCKAVGPDYVRPTSTLPAQFAQADAQATAANMNQWWVLYQDPQLTALIEKAQKNNTDIQFAVARIEEADAIVGTGSYGELARIFEPLRRREKVFEVQPRPRFLLDKDSPRKRLTAPHSTYIKIRFNCPVRI